MSINLLAKKDIETKAAQLVSAAKTMTVKDELGYLEATSVLQQIKSSRKELDGWLDPVIASAYKAHKEACAAKRKVEQPLTEAEWIIKGKVAEYLEAQERWRLLEEKRLSELAKSLDDDRKLNDALDLENAGLAQEAEAALNEESAALPVLLPSSVPKVEGLSSRKIWKFKITDPLKIPRIYLLPDMAKIGSVVRALKEQANIPGVEVYSESSIAVRTDE